METRAGSSIVCKYRIRPDEHVIFQSHAVPHIDPAFQGHPIADRRAPLDQCVRVEVAVGADHRPVHHHTKLPHPRPCADRRAGMHEGQRVDLGVGRVVVDANTDAVPVDRAALSSFWG